MPFYSYRDTSTGAVVERCVPLAERDAQPGLERIWEPAVARCGLGAGGRPSLQARQVLGGYRQLEDRGELRMGRQAAARVREVWAAGAGE